MSVIYFLQNKTDAVVGKSLKGTVSLINPLPIALTNGKFVIEASGLKNRLEIKVTGSIQPGKKANGDFTITPKIGGKSVIAVRFSSKELTHVHGFLIFQAQSAENKRSTCPLS